MIVKLLTEHNLEFLSLKGGCTGPSESTHVKMPHCWKSHAPAQVSIVKKEVGECMEHYAKCHVPNEVIRMGYYAISIKKKNRTVTVCQLLAQHSFILILLLSGW